MTPILVSRSRLQRPIKPDVGGCDCAASVLSSSVRPSLQFWSCVGAKLGRFCEASSRGITGGCGIGGFARSSAVRGHNRAQIIPSGIDLFS